jgi:hypothetical protein
MKGHCEYGSDARDSGTRARVCRGAGARQIHAAADAVGRSRHLGVVALPTTCRARRTSGQRSSAPGRHSTTKSLPRGRRQERSR